MEENIVYQKWNSLGFLDGLSEDNKIKLANAFEYTACKLLADADVNKENRKYNDDVDTIAFPILRRVVTMLPLLELTEDFIDGFLLKVLGLTESSVYDGIKDLHADPQFDVEAELIKLFVKLNYGQ